MRRREVFPILGATAAAAQTAAAPRFFSAAQYGTLGAFADTLLPRDGEAPGALDVRVPWFIDTTLHYTESAPRKAWVDGLAALDSQARGGSFAALPADERVKLLEALSSAEGNPGSAAERFFVFAKRQIVEAWALSEDAQRRGLGYRGNTAVQAFHGHD